MIEGKKGFCYLAKVTGRFRGPYEEVAVTKEEKTWYLGGKSKQKGGGVAASAMCVLFPDSGITISEPHPWKKGEKPKQILPPSKGDSGFCVLTKVGGLFNGPSDNVNVDYNYDESLNKVTWYVGGNSGQNLTAESVCVKKK